MNGDRLYGTPAKKGKSTRPRLPASGSLSTKEPHTWLAVSGVDRDKNYFFKSSSNFKNISIQRFCNS